MVIMKDFVISQYIMVFSAKVTSLTLFGIWSDFLHQSNEGVQELCVVARKLQLFAVFPKK